MIGISHGAIAVGQRKADLRGAVPERLGRYLLGPRRAGPRRRAGRPHDSVWSPRASPLPRKPDDDAREGPRRRHQDDGSRGEGCPHGALAATLRWLSASAMTAGHTLRPPPTARIAPGGKRRGDRQQPGHRRERGDGVIATVEDRTEQERCGQPDGEALPPARGEQRHGPAGRRSRYRPPRTAGRTATVASRGGRSAPNTNAASGGYCHIGSSEGTRPSARPSPQPAYTFRSSKMCFQSWCSIIPAATSRTNPRVSAHQVSR